MTRRRWLTLLVALATLGALSVLVSRLPELSDPRTLSESLLRSGPWAPLVGLGMMVLQSLISPIPYALVVLALGATLGPYWGAAVAWVGELLGGSLAYWLARMGWDSSSTPAWLEGRRGFWGLLLVRLAPGISFDLVSYACGAARVPFHTFLVATALGMAPRALALTFLGHALWDDPGQALVLALALVPLYLLGAWFLTRRRGTPREE